MIADRPRPTRATAQKCQSAESDPTAMLMAQARGITRGRVTMPRLKFGTARLSVLRSRYSPPERSEGPSGVAAARALFANCEPPTRRPPAAPEAPSRTTITTRSVELGPMPFWRRRGRIRFYHPPSVPPCPSAPAHRWNSGRQICRCRNESCSSRERLMGTILPRIPGYDPS